MAQERNTLVIETLSDFANLQTFCRGLKNLERQKVNCFWMQHRYSGRKVCLTVLGAYGLTIAVERPNNSPSKFYLRDNREGISFSWHEGHYFASPTFRLLAEKLSRLDDVPKHVINLVQHVGGEVGYRGIFRLTDTP